MSEDTPTGLVFVDPDDTPTTFRVALFAPPGSGKSVTAASAPTPNLLLSADRPAAYAFARKHHGLTANDLREVRYVGPGTLDDVYRYLGSPAGADVKTVTVDPVSNIYDNLRDVAPKASDGDVDYSWVNGKLFGFIKSLRRFDVHVVLVAHEKLNDGKKGDGKVYPHFGGMTLINKILGELDICAHIERVLRPVEGQEEPEPVWIGQLQPRDNLVCKESIGYLGDRRVANLSRWFEVAAKELQADDADVPWSENYQPPADQTQEGEEGLPDTGDEHDEGAEIAGLQDLALELWSELETPAKAKTRLKKAGENVVQLRALVEAAQKVAENARVAA